MTSGFCSIAQRGLSTAALFFLLTYVAAADEWRVAEAGAFYPKRSPQMAIAADGTPVIAYYDGKGGILIRRMGLDPRRLNDSPQAGKPSGLALAAVGGNLVTAWRERRKEKWTLVLRRSTDDGKTWSDATLIGSATRPLTRIQLGGDSSNLYLLWLGSRLDENPEPMPLDPEEGEDAAREKPGYSYHIYAARSGDGGRSWGETVKLTEGHADSIWPTLLVKDNRAYSFTASVKGGKRRILVRWSENDNDWSDPVPIKEVGNIMLMRAVALDDGIIIQWLAAYPGHYLLEGAVSRDGGYNWDPFAVEETKSLDIANLETAVQGEQVNTVFSARSRRQDTSKMQTIYHLRSGNGGREWEKLRILRQDPFPWTQALYPRIIGRGKKLVAIWSDFRNFRGNLYHNYSTDGGKTWLPDDVPLEPRGRRNTYLFPFSPSLAEYMGHYFLLAGRYADDSFSPAVELVLLRFEPHARQPERNLMDDPGSEKKTALLREQAERYWNHLMEGRYESVYDLFDPFFRGRYRNVDYLAANGMVKHRKYEIEAVRVQGNLGRVTLRYTYEIPTLATRLGTITRPPTEARITETWLFIDGNWHKEYRSESTGTRYGRY